MSYPQLIANRKKLEHNTKIIVDRCAEYGVAVTAVTKCYCGLPVLAEAQVVAGVSMLADSRVENLKKLKDLSIPKMLIRIPMLSQVKEVVKFADISLNSEISVIKALGAEAITMNKTHKIMLMIDVGDLREGVMIEEAKAMVDQIGKVEGVELIGIGANYACFGGVMPEYDNIAVLSEVALYAEETIGAPIEIISGGNSCTYQVMREGRTPDSLNHLRLGEIILLGYDSMFDRKIEGSYTDAFTLVAEIIELKEKPSKPIGTIGIDAFGNVPVFEDKGIRKRAILAIGRQDIRIENITPRLEGAEIVGGSSDHMILDVTQCEKDLKVGDLVEFDMAYGGLLSAFTSEYVEKVIL